MLLLFQFVFACLFPLFCAKFLPLTFLLRQARSLSDLSLLLMTLLPFVVDHSELLSDSPRPCVLQVDLYARF